MTHEHDSHCVPDEPMYVEVGVYLCARRHLFELEGQTAWSVTCPVCACTASVQSVYTRVAMTHEHDRGCRYCDEERERRNANVTDRQIEQLRTEAGAHGDLAQVAICDRALAGSAAARQACARVMRNGGNP